MNQGYSVVILKGKSAPRLIRGVGPFHSTEAANAWCERQRLSQTPSDGEWGSVLPQTRPTRKRKADAALAGSEDRAVSVLAIVRGVPTAGVHRLTLKLPSHEFALVPRDLAREAYPAVVAAPGVRLVEIPLVIAAVMRALGNPGSEGLREVLPQGRPEPVFTAHV